MKGKLLITRYKSQILTCIFKDSKIIELKLSNDNKPYNIGDIYVGKVKDVKKNINAAFIEFKKDQIGFFSLDSNSIKSLLPNDLVVVQVTKDSLKSKMPYLKSDINLVSRNVILNAYSEGVSFSSKISDTSWKNSISSELNKLLPKNTSLLIRTNAYDLTQNNYEQGIDLIKDEIKHLLIDLEDINTKARYYKKFSLLHSGECDYLKDIKDAYISDIDEILTDDESVYNSIKKYLSLNEYNKIDIRYYNDKNVSLNILYGIETTIKKATSKKVWLSSGAYIIIEYTEALTVIDVNSGKTDINKSKAASTLAINLEAAKEIAYQIRLRNITGIIIIDFIGMNSEEQRSLLISSIKDLIKSDPIKTQFIDITKLDLVELTRMKIRMPLHEQIQKMFDNHS